MAIVDGDLSIAISLKSIQFFSRGDLENAKGRRLAGAVHDYRVERED